MKKQSAYNKGIVSGFLILLFLCILTVFPNIWEYFGAKTNVLLFKAVPFAIFILSLSIIICLSEGMNYIFYLERKGEKVKTGTAFSFFSPNKFLRLLKFYSSLYTLKALIFAAVFLPVAVINVMSILFYIDGSPVLSVLIMLLVSVVSLFLSVKFYGEANSFFFLSRYFFFENEKRNFKSIIRLSLEKTKGKTGKIRILKQSFFLSFLSCILLVPIPFVLTNYKKALSKKAYEMMR